MSIAEIEKMSVKERIYTMELLWDSISRGDGEVDSPDWHAEVLSERMCLIESGEAEFLTMDELREELR